VGLVESPEGQLVRFTYDVFSRRVSKEIYRKPAAGKVAERIASTRFVWDGNALLHEIRTRADDAGDPVVEERSYCFEEGGGEPLAQRRTLSQGGRSEREEWLVYLNTPSGAPDRLVTAAGEVAAEISWGAWGDAEIASGSTADTPIGLQGQYIDAETGLHYNRQHYYDPDAGRFISPDPIGLRGAFHPYLYAPNTISWVDPDGLSGYHANGRPTLLGRGMDDRVTPTSDNPQYLNGASGPSSFHTFRPNSQFEDGDPGAERAWKKNQRRWMRDQINSGREVYDIGTPSGWSPSKYCGIEQKELQAAGFTKKCTGKKMMVNGIETPLHRWEPPPGFTPGDYRPRTAAECRGTP
jgi:RHS repeat-associated protein